MLRFQLFRIKVQRPAQKSLFHPDEPSPVILRTAILEKPSAELRRGYTWHIGNIANIDQDGLYFALGRTTSSIVERYDIERRDFIEEEFETAPYTHVLLDIHLAVCVIAGKSKLAPTILGIARQLGKLLDKSQVARDREIKFEVSEINDPEDFISHLQSAYAIHRFSITFTYPNPFDVNRDFHAPMEMLLREASGEKGKTSIGGRNLNPTLLEELARSAAAIGNDAEAKIQSEQHQKPVRKRLRGNPATIEEESLDSDDEKRGLLNRVRDFYARIRQHPERSQTK